MILRYSQILLILVLSTIVLKSNSYSDERNILNNQLLHYDIFKNDTKLNDHLNDKFEQIFISADITKYDENKNFIYLQGNVQIITDTYYVIANSLLYDIKNDSLFAQGNVRISDNQNNIVYGNLVFFQDQLKKGIIDDLTLKLKNNSVLIASLAHKIDEDNIELIDASFTPCIIHSNCSPIWQISANNAYVKKDDIVYKHVFFLVYGVPIMYLPYLSHPKPGSEGRSGILIPNMKYNTLAIPIYYRPKPNFEVLFTPRIGSDYRIFELEANHLLPYGKYGMQTSYSKVQDIVTKQKTIDTKSNRYYLFFNGNFNINNYHYDFSIKRVSDKAYLKNYYHKSYPYLLSEISLNHIEDFNYFSITGLSFQGLRANNSKKTDPFVFPRIRTKNIFFLNDDENIYFTLKNNFIGYHQDVGNQLSRYSLFTSISDKIITDNGHIVNATLQNRKDVYFIRQSSLYNDNFYHHKTLSRDIPEIHINWKYPIIYQLGYKTSILEPIVSFTNGLNCKADKNKYFIDPDKYELTPSNLFLSNHYSGIDYHEFGKRLSYGFNNTIAFNKNYLNVFIGQFLSDKNSITPNANKQIVGSSSIDVSNINLHYKFRKDKKWRAIIDEIGGNVNAYPLYLGCDIIKISDVQKYYTVDKIDLKLPNKISQFRYYFKYNVTDSFVIEHDAAMDLLHKKMRFFYKGIKLTYVKDCVSTSLKFYDDYTFDPSRGIKKVNSKSISIGLTTLNM
ncbi:MAG: LPS-assembly protein LptD [Rickettsiaceae bacterium]